jgi:hypothetical protein
LGERFVTGVRPTHVEIALVTLTKKAENRFNFFSDFESVGELNLEDVDFATAGSSQIKKADLFRDMVDNYSRLCDQYVKYLREYQRLHMLASAFPFRLDEVLKDAWEGQNPKDRYNRFVDQVKSSAWTDLFRKTKFVDLLTSQVKEKFEAQQELQGQVEFNLHNIFKMLDLLIDNRGMIMAQCIEHVFDKMTSWHDKNKIHFEGWKTNDAFKVNRRVILPYLLTRSIISGTFEVRYDYRWGFIKDIDKAMCALTGKPIENIVTVSDALEEKFKEVGNPPSGTFDNQCESEFFEMKFFKKGLYTYSLKMKKCGSFSISRLQKLAAGSPENYNGNLFNLDVWLYVVYWPIGFH